MSKQQQQAEPIGAHMQPIQGDMSAAPTAATGGGREKRPEMPRGRAGGQRAGNPLGKAAERAIGATAAAESASGERAAPASAQNGARDVPISLLDGIMRRAQELAPGQPAPEQDRSVIPMMPSLLRVAPYKVSDEVTDMLAVERPDLSALGECLDHALGFLAALLEHGRLKAALDACGVPWSIVRYFFRGCPDYWRIYQDIHEALNEQRVQALRDAAYDRATKGQPRGIYWDGKRIATEHYPSDKLAEFLLQGLDPDTFGAASEQGAGVAVQIHIGV